MTTSRFSQWWREKGDVVNKRRRDKYNNNEFFRAKELERKRKARQKSRRRRFPRPRIYHYENTPVVLWSVGRVADYLGISKRTISNLEAKGSIPINRVVDDLRRRWWPEDYIKWLKPFVDLRKSKEISSKEFSRRVWNSWREASQTNEFPTLSERKENDEQESKEKEDSQECRLTDVFDARRPNSRQG